MKLTKLLLVLLGAAIMLAQGEWCGADGGKKKKRKKPVVVQELSPFYGTEGAWSSNIRRTPPAGNVLSDFIFVTRAGVLYKWRNTVSGSEWAAQASYARHQFASNAEQSNALAQIQVEGSLPLSGRLRLEGGYDLGLNRSIEGRDFNIYTGNTDYIRNAFRVEARRLVNKREWWKAGYSFAKSEYSDPTYDLRDGTANRYGVEWWKRFSPAWDASTEYSFTDMNVTQGGYARDVHLLSVHCDRKIKPEAEWRFSAALRRSLFDTFDDGGGPFDRKDTRASLTARYSREPLSAGVEYLRNISNDNRAVVDFGDFTAWTIYANWKKRL